MRFGVCCSEQPGARGSLQCCPIEGNPRRPRLHLGESGVQGVMLDAALKAGIPASAGMTVGASCPGGTPLRKSSQDRPILPHALKKPRGGNQPSKLPLRPPSWWRIFPNLPRKAFAAIKSATLLICSGVKSPRRSLRSLSRSFIKSVLSLTIWSSI